MRTRGDFTHVHPPCSPTRRPASIHYVNQHIRIGQVVEEGVASAPTLIRARDQTRNILCRCEGVECEGVAPAPTLIRTRDQAGNILLSVGCGVVSCEDVSSAPALIRTRD